jgi:biotin carboxyl carrier protein
MTIREFHSFAGHPGQFWPAFLEFAGRQAKAHFSLLLVKNSSHWKALDQWTPDHRRRTLSDPLLNVFTKLAEKCLENGAGSAQVDISARTTALGLLFDWEKGEPTRVAIFCVNGGPATDVNEILTRLHLIADTPAVYQRERAARQRQKDVACFADVLDLLLLLNAENRFLAAAMTLVNETAARYHCTRASLGWCENGYVRLQSISHMERFERKMDIVSDLEAAMEEAVDQDEEIIWPCLDADGAVTRDHEAYAKKQQTDHLVSLPLRIGDQSIGVLTCERNQTVFSEDDVRSLRILGDQVSYRLAEIKKKDRWFGAKLIDAIRHGASGLLGVDHTLGKLVGLLTCALLLISVFIKLPYRIEAPFILRSQDVRQVSVPFDGYIDAVSVKIGQKVARGDRLLLLDTSDLLLEESAALANQIRFQREAEKARAQNNLIEMKIAQARQAQARAKLELIRHHLIQAQISSPIAGIIVEGDLEELQGAPVEKGDILFKVARHENIYVEVEIGEDDVHEVAEGQSGQIAFVSRPQLKYPFKIRQIDPVAVAKDTGNIFIARGENLELSVDWWRPGMSGIAKLDVGPRRILWIITHRTIEFFQMLLWW